MELYRLTGHLNLRPNPSPDPPSLGIFNRGTVVQGIGHNADGTWLQVRIPKPDGTFHEGWMSMKFLTKLSSAPLTWRLGANLRELAYYGSGANKVRFTTEAFRNQQLILLRDLGVRLVRFFASQVEFDAAGSLPFIRRTLDLLASFGMEAVVCLDDSMTGAEQYMPGNNASHAGPDGHLIADYWQQKRYQQTYLPHIRKIVTEFRNHPAVLLWELGNEFAIHPQPPRAGDDMAFLGFVKETSQEIKRIAPNQRVSLGLIVTHNVFSQNPADDRSVAAARLYGLASVDAVGIHYYHHDFAHLKPYIDIDIQVARDLGKPFYVGEIGAKFDTPNRPAYYADEIKRWKQAGAFSVMPWQLDSSVIDVGVGDMYGVARWRDGDYQAICDELKPLA